LLTAWVVLFAEGLLERAALGIFCAAVLVFFDTEIS
jgi:hypothetical protein